MRPKTIQQCKILIGCFVINLVYGAVGRLSSIFFVESIVYYNVDRKQASLPFTLVFMVRSLCGPFIGYLEQIVGMKLLITLGNALATICLAVCFFAENILVITIFYGGLLGISFSVGTQFLPLILNAHFSENRNKANGLSFAGACIGGIICPPLIELCIYYYGISGSFLILSAIVANSLPASLLLQNPEDKIENFPPQIKTKEEKKTDIASTRATINETENKPPHKACNKIGTNKKLVFTMYQPKCTTYNDSKISESIKNLDLNKIASQNKKKSIFTVENFKIFFNPVFIDMLFINAGSSFIITTVWTVILDFVRDKGVKTNLEIFYVMILPVGDLVARLASGFLIDKKWLKTSNLAVICFIGQALALTGILFANNYILLMFVEILFPVFSGSIIILQMALVQEYIETSKKTMAMVCRLLLYVPLNLTSSPMIGHFRGNRGSYDGVFYILTAISIFCGFITYFIPHLSKKKQFLSKANDFQ